MGNFKSDNRRGFGGRFGSRDGFRGRDSERSTEMHEAICSKCGKNCQVPFKPTGSKPVLCSDCFRQSGSGRDSGRSSRGNFNSRNQDRRSDGPSQYQSGISSEQFNQINAKLDKILGVLQELEIDSDEDSEENSEK
jgi:CxxC-x17-CxxC domain-containing protein